jgi:hypothetical protein
MNVILPLMSTTVSIVFSAFVFAQFVTRRKVYQLLWGVGMLMYAVSTGCEFVGGLAGWSDPVYRMWYLFGAILVAAYLGQGTIYLLVPRRIAHAVMALLLLSSIYATYAVLAASIDMSLIMTGIHTATGQGMPAGVRLLTPFFNTFGTFALVGGALYSAWVLWRRRILPHRVTANFLIAGGTLFIAFTGAIAKMGTPEFLYAGELIGSLVIFVGFLESRRISVESKAQTREASGALADQSKI